MTVVLPPILIRSDILNSYDERKLIVSASLEAGYQAIFIRSEDEQLQHMGRYCVLTIENDSVIYNGEKIGSFMHITSMEDMEKAYCLKNSVQYLIIAPDNWRVIPMENLISRFQASGTKVYMCVQTPDEARLAFETMEVGCDGIVISPKNPTELIGFSGIYKKSFPEVDLEPAEITQITNLSLGDRVCIDTCSLLEQGEGMLIGSQSSCLFLICSESFESEYVNSRPFRVNAGAIHSYILCPDGTTKYLSELSAGKELLSRKVDGTLRSVSIGRVKIEIRPMLFIEVQIDGAKYSVVVQNAETIRFGTPNGAVSVADLKIGDTILVRRECGGRHFGHAMAETICEK